MLACACQSTPSQSVARTRGGRKQAGRAAAGPSRGGQCLRTVAGSRMQQMLAVSRLCLWHEQAPKRKVDAEGRLAGLSQNLAELGTEITWQQKIAVANC